MQFDFDPKHAGQTAAEVSYACAMFAQLFASAVGMQLDDEAVCGLMLQFQAMGRAMEQLEDHIGGLEIALGKRAA